MYFIMAVLPTLDGAGGINPMVKIGTTNNMRRRFSELLAQHEKADGKWPDYLGDGCGELFLIGAIPGGRSQEALLHRALKPHALGYEWFQCNYEVEQAIDRLLDEHCICDTCYEAGKWSR